MKENELRWERRDREGNDTEREDETEREGRVYGCCVGDILLAVYPKVIQNVTRNYEAVCRSYDRKIVFSSPRISQYRG